MTGWATTSGWSATDTQANREHTRELLAHAIEEEPAMPDNTQGQDGTPHVTYFDKPHQLSFVWDGTAGPWIDVAYGGYAEAVIARIPYRDSASHALVDFKTACDRFIETIDVSVGNQEANA